MIKIKWVLAAVMISLLVGCAITKKDWQRAQRLNTIRAYQEFIKKHPQSRFTFAAQCRMEYLEWQKTKQLDTIEAYLKFISKYPNSEFIHKAEARIEELDWEKAKQINTIKAYRLFLRMHPYSKFTSEAINRIAKIEQENKFKKILEASNNLKVHLVDTLGIIIQELDKNTANAIGYQDFEENGGVLIIDVRKNFSEPHYQQPGFKPGDIIVSIDEKVYSTFNEWVKKLKSIKKNADFLIWRNQIYFLLKISNNNRAIKKLGKSLYDPSYMGLSKRDVESRLGKPDFAGFTVVVGADVGIETWVYKDACNSRYSLLSTCVAPYCNGFLYLYFDDGGIVTGQTCSPFLEIHVY